jgi:hypothetical protein
MDRGNWRRAVRMGMVSSIKGKQGRRSLTRLHSLVALKVLLGLSLLSYSALRQAGMEEREAEDAVNDFGRPAVGESKEETASCRSRSEQSMKQDKSTPGVQQADNRVSVPRRGRLARVHLSGFSEIAYRRQDGGDRQEGEEVEAGRG